MNWDQVEGNWKQFKGKVKEQWGKLTDDHLTGSPADGISFRRIQESYGLARKKRRSKFRMGAKTTGIPVGLALKRAAFPLCGMLLTKPMY